MTGEDTFEYLQQICLKVVQSYERQENISYFRMSEKDIFSVIGIDSEIDTPLLKKCRISRERKGIILRSALYGFLKEELSGANCLLNRKDYRLKIPEKYQTNLSILKDDFRNYLNNKILEGRYI